MRFILEVKDNRDGKALMDFLKHLPFVKVKETQKKKRKKVRFEDIFGIWAKRDINKEKLRKEAWRI